MYFTIEHRLFKNNLLFHFVLVIISLPSHTTLRIHCRYPKSQGNRGGDSREGLLVVVVVGLFCFVWILTQPRLLLH